MYQNVEVTEDRIIVAAPITIGTAYILPGAPFTYID